MKSIITRTMATGLFGGDNFLRNLSQSLIDTILKVCSPDSARAQTETGKKANTGDLLQVKTPEKESKPTTRILGGEIISRSIDAAMFDFLISTVEVYTRTDGIIVPITENGKGLVGLEANLPKVNLFGSDWDVQWTYGVGFGNKLTDMKVYAQSTQSNNQTDNYWSVGSGARSDLDPYFVFIDLGSEKNNVGTRSHTEFSPARGVAEGAVIIAASLIPEKKVDSSLWSAGQVPTGESSPLDKLKEFFKDDE